MGRGTEDSPPIENVVAQLEHTRGSVCLHSHCPLRDQCGMFRSDYVAATLPVALWPPPPPPNPLPPRGRRPPRRPTEKRQKQGEGVRPFPPRPPEAPHLTPARHHPPGGTSSPVHLAPRRPATAAPRPPPRRPAASTLRPPCAPTAPRPRDGGVGGGAWDLCTMPLHDFPSAHTQQLREASKNIGQYDDCKVWYQHHNVRHRAKKKRPADKPTGPVERAGRRANQPSNPRNPRCRMKAYNRQCLPHRHPAPRPTAGRVLPTKLHTPGRFLP